MAGAFCTKCGEPIGPSDRFCSSCGASIGETPVAAAVSGPVVAPAASLPTPSDTTALTRFGRIARTVALLGFLLPWVTVSCAGQTIASVSGLRLATGVVAIRNPMNGAIETHAGTANWAMLLTALAIALALLVSFLPARRTAALLGLALSAAAAILAIYAVMIDIPEQLATGIRDRPDGGDFGASLTHTAVHAIRVDSGIGFWITLLALGVAAVLDWRVQRRPRPAAG
jgi:hypothetical protein